MICLAVAIVSAWAPTDKTPGAPEAKAPWVKAPDAKAVWGNAEGGALVELLSKSSSSTSISFDELSSSSSSSVSMMVSGLVGESELEVEVGGGGGGGTNVVLLLGSDTMADDMLTQGWYVECFGSIVGQKSI